MKTRNDFYDVGAELDRVFGKEGTDTYNKAIEEAWEEYNAQMLLDARKEAHLTQQELAEKIGVDKGYISKIERGLIVPSVATFYRITSAMGKQIALV